MASKITSLTIVYSNFYSGADQRKHQISASLAFVRGIHRWPVNSPHKWPVTRKTFPFDDVFMNHFVTFLSTRGQIIPSATSSCIIYIFSTWCGLICIILYTVWPPLINMALISNHVYSKMWDEIINPFPNFNGATIYIGCNYLSIPGS